MRCFSAFAAMRLRQEQQKFDQAVNDWERWQARAADEREVARQEGQLEVRKTLGAQLAEEQSRRSTDRTNIER
jgi:hypothetical protein